jgi:hypothetical protein
MTSQANYCQHFISLFAGNDRTSDSKRGLPQPKKRLPNSNLWWDQSASFYYYFKSGSLPQPTIIFAYQPARFSLKLCAYTDQTASAASVTEKVTHRIEGREYQIRRIEYVEFASH